MADRSITIHDPNTNSTVIIFMSIATDGAGNLSFNGSGGVDFQYTPNNSSTSAATVFPADVSGAQLTALKNALAPFFSAARTKMGF